MSKWLFVATIAFWLSFSGCQINITSYVQAFYGTPVKVSSSDTTPPTVTLTATKSASNGQVAVVSGGQPVTLPLTTSSDGFYIVGFADDPQGVKEVDIYVNPIGPTCSANNGVGSTSSIDVVNPASSQVWNGQPGMGWTRLTTIFNFVPSEWTGCPNGGKLQSAQVQMQAFGVNYGGQKVSTPIMTFAYPAQ